MEERKVLVTSQERVAERMAGPAIRAYEIARALAATPGLAVTLAAPPGSTIPDEGGSSPQIALEEVDLGTAVLLDLAKRHDVVISQFVPGSILARLAKGGTPLVMDLYNPLALEALERGRDDELGRRGRRVRAASAATLSQLAAADFVICASERQRDLLIGGLTLTGLLDPGRYSADPSYRSVVDVVPFGIPDEPPRRGMNPVLKGAWPGIAPDDRVALWTGGVWDWLDALTAVKAVELARRDVPNLKLFFLGTGRPPQGDADEFTAMGATSELERHLAENDLENEVVFVNRDWVPYAERAAYLLEADLALSAHHDHLEARYAYRARILDCLWAGLPLVATKGDVLGDLIAERGLGRAVPAGDPSAMAKAIVALLQKEGERERASDRIATLAPELRWSKAVEPLRRFCLERQLERRSGRPGARRLIGRSRLHQLSAVLSDRGLTGIASEAIAKVRRLTSRG